MRPVKSAAPLGIEILKTAIFKTPTRFFCKNCEQYVPSTMPWICGRCGNAHTEVRLYSFLYKCKECKRRPDGIECPHCKTIWGFSKRGEVRFPARKLSAANPPTTTPETEAEKRKREHRERKEELERQHEIAELVQKLKDVEKKSNPKHMRALEEEQEEIMEDFYRRFGKDLAIDRLRKTIEEEYKNSPRLPRLLECIADVERNRA